MLRLHILASGSGGKRCHCGERGDGRGVLIDCGICKRDFFARAEEAGFDLELRLAVVITHDHGDHTKGLGVVLRGLAKAGRVLRVRQRGGGSRPRRRCAMLWLAWAPRSSPSAGRCAEAAGLAVRPFRTSHDAADSYGFRFEERVQKVAIPRLHDRHRCRDR